MIIIARVNFCFLSLRHKKSFIQISSAHYFSYLSTPHLQRFCVPPVVLRVFCIWLCKVKLSHIDVLTCCPQKMTNKKPSMVEC